MRRISEKDLGTKCEMLERRLGKRVRWYSENGSYYIAITAGDTNAIGFVLTHWGTKSQVWDEATVICNALDYVEQNGRN